MAALGRFALAMERPALGRLPPGSFPNPKLV